MKLARFILALLLLISASAHSLEISAEEAKIIGQRIYLNECGGDPEKLIWWNDGEKFASLGIGHFIWYPQDQRGPFEETFPLLLTFLKEKGVEMPEWLKKSQGCPWDSKEQFLASDAEGKKHQLRGILEQSLPLQARFIAQCFTQAVPQLLEGLTTNQRTHLLTQLQRVGNSLQGKYALIDYLNFKGKGTLETERYKGEGWGLRQVLLNMSGKEKDALAAFQESAKELLRRRVQNAPAERKESRWLSGWLARIDSYRKS